MLDKLQLTKYKATAALAVMGVLPTAADKVAVGYHHVYEMSSGYASRTWDSGLSLVGLQRKIADMTDDELIEIEAKNFGVNPLLVRSLKQVESGNSPDAYSLKGAIGLMQVMPFNAKRCGLKSISELWDRHKNIRCGTQIFSEELTTYNNDVEKAVRSYNGGPICVKHECAESVKHYKKVINTFATLAFPLRKTRK